MRRFPMHPRYLFAPSSNTPSLPAEISMLKDQSHSVAPCLPYIIEHSRSGFSMACSPFTRRLLGSVLLLLELSLLICSFFNRVGPFAVAAAIPVWIFKACCAGELMEAPIASGSDSMGLISVGFSFASLPARRDNDRLSLFLSWS